jgi:hypothetical protein
MPEEVSQTPRGPSNVASSVPGHCRDQTAFRIDTPQEVVLHLEDEHVAARIESHLVGLVERGRRGGAAIARIALAAAPRNGTEPARLRVEP